MGSNHPSPNALLVRFGHLPVTTVLKRLTESLRHGHALLSAPTGSGKTTLIPPALLAGPLFAEGTNRILMLEPRRIAARAAATRMSEMIGERVGATVGYRTRIESRVSSATRIEVVTEGILIRQLQRDPELAGYSLVIFDEFHERSLQADLGLALCLDLTELRDDLRLLVMSATLATESICRLLGDAPHIAASGKSYPVQVEHLVPPGQTLALPQQVVHGVCHAWNKTDGDILTFLPGAGEIQRCRDLLSERLPQALILPLYGSLSHQEQDRIFRPEPDRRRVILATPIAETSLTIDRIGAVVDSGYCRRPVFDLASGLTRLVTVRIAKSSAEQRAGRAGRIGPGRCYRLWPLEVHHSLLDHTPPEIIGADLSSLVLELALWGVADPGQLRWLDPPRQSSWRAAAALLERLALLDPKGRITSLGRTVAALPLHPRLGTMLVKGAEMGLAWTAALLAALISERDIFTGRDRPVDLVPRIRLVADTADRHDPRHSATAPLRHRIVDDARRMLAHLGTVPEAATNPEMLGTLLAYGYPDRIAHQRPGSSSRYLLSGGSGAELPAGDGLGASPLLVIPHLDGRQGDSRIFLAAAITEDDLFAHHGHLIDKRREIGWEKREKKVKAEMNTCLGALVLASRTLHEADETLVLSALLDGVRQEGCEALPWSREARELQARLCSLHHWLPQEWPDMSDEVLMADLEWLAPYCVSRRSLTQLGELDMRAILLSRYSWNEQQQIDHLAPSHLQVPSGSRIRLDYRPKESPVLAVRLQEMFGQIDTPRICRDTIPVLVHLLSPARRPMQVTTDLRSFWSTTYPEVRKELAGRYPKHYWPEDPLTATATALTKKQMAARK